MHAILSSKCEPFRFSLISENSEIKNQRNKSWCMIVFGSYHVIHKRLNIIGKLLYLWTQQPSDWHWFLSIHSIFLPNDLVSYKQFYSLWYHLRFESTDRNRFEKSEQKKPKMLDMIDHEQRELNKSLHGGTFCLNLFPKEFESICRFDDH